MTSKQKTATFIKRLDDWRACAKLFKLEPPYQKQRHVIVSAVTVFDVPETFIFPATAGGEAKSMLEMDGSRKGTLSHEKVLKEIGYTVQ